jgi:hypothetical protein
MKLRNNKVTTDVWPVVQNTMGTRQTWYDVLLQLQALNVGAWERDKSYQRKVFIKSCYVMLNNKKFFRQLNYRKVVTAMVLKFDCPSVPPKYVRDLFHKVRRLTPQGIARQRWSILRASMKFLSLHSRAVITANHPSRMDFTIKDD